MAGKKWGRGGDDVYAMYDAAADNAISKLKRSGLRKSAAASVDV